MDRSSLLIPRAVILLLAPLQFAIVAWYFLYWDLFPKYSVRRVVPWLLFVLSGIGIPLLQISIYRAITAVARIDDPFVSITIFVESMMSVALVFYLLRSRRMRREHDP
jgi:hypothetical protein